MEEAGNVTIEQPGNEGGNTEPGTETGGENLPPGLERIGNLWRLNGGFVNDRTADKLIAEWRENGGGSSGLESGSGGEAFAVGEDGERTGRVQERVRRTKKRQSGGGGKEEGSENGQTSAEAGTEERKTKKRETGRTERPSPNEPEVSRQRTPFQKTGGVEIPLSDKKNKEDFGLVLLLIFCLRGLTDLHRFSKPVLPQQFINWAGIQIDGKPANADILQNLWEFEDSELQEIADAISDAMPVLPKPAQELIQKVTPFGRILMVVWNNISDRINTERQIRAAYTEFRRGYDAGTIGTGATGNGTNPSATGVNPSTNGGGSGAQPPAEHKQNAGEGKTINTDGFFPKF